MTRRSPFFAIWAMLWEIWRVTRVEAAWKLALWTVGAMAVLAASSSASEIHKDSSAAIALVLIVMPHLVGWRSMAKLNSGRRGFPLYLLYTRPVRTAVIVGLPMAYLTAVSWAIYLVSALLLRVTSGYAFPLLPVAAWMAALTLVWVAAAWSTRNWDIQVSVMVCAITGAFLLAMHRLTGVEIEGNYDWPPRLWPTLFDFPLADYAWIALIGLASFGVTVAGVTRQRRGDGWVEVPSAQRDGFWDRRVNLFRFPCPTSSATQAQVWLELRSRGLPLLSIGVQLAIVNLLLYAVSRAIDTVRPMAMLFAMFSVPAVLALGGNAFGILAKQGRVYAGAFEATQPYGTGRLAVLKVLVRSGCLLAALTAVGVSVLAPGTLVGAEILGDPWRSLVPALEGAVGALTPNELFALAVAGSIGVAVMVASRAALGALWTRYPRRVKIAGSLLLLYFLVLGLLALAGQRGIGPEISLGAILRATSWMAASAIVLMTGYLLWRGVAEKLLTLGHACGAVLVSAAFGAAWVTLLRAAGMPLAGIPAADAAWMLSPALLPLTIGVLSPWSYSRIRHT